MTSIAEAMSQALGYYNAGDLPSAEAIFLQIVLYEPTHAEALHFLGIIAQQKGNPDSALDYLQRSLVVSPHNAQAHATLGVVLQTAGRLGEAVESYRQALQLRPDYPQALSNLGNALTAQGELQEATACCRRALELRPGYAQAHINLAVALLASGDLDEAKAHALQAIALPGDFAEAHNTLGSILFLQGKEDEALHHYRRALQIQPQHAQTRCNLAAVLLGQGKLDEAEAQLRSALSLQPRFAGAHLNLGGVLQHQGRLDDAVSWYRQALSLDPAFAAALSNLLLCLNYDPQISGETLLQEHRQWGIRFGNPTASFGCFSAGNQTCTPDRRLRLGYVSPDLRSHAVTRFLLPIFANHNPEQVETICYADLTSPDAVSAELKKLAGGWRFIDGLTDAQAAHLIREDCIDILVDLAGHTANSRLGVFVHKPAPIQVSYLGYPCTTGLAAIDYYITDEIVDPSGEPSAFVEELIRLPRGFCTYAPSGSAPRVSALPAKSNGFITFGSFHQLIKLNNQVLDLWSAILRAAPNARLLVFRHTLQGRAREHLSRRFMERGIDLGRIDFLCSPLDDQGYLGMYAKVDVSLDTFPWCGHTTACESLWMGAPVITLRGSRHASRMVASVLTMAGLPEWVADSKEQYIDLAVRWTKDLESLVALRTGLRDRLARSSLCDGKGFTRSLEAAYRKIWQHCCSEKNRLLPQQGVAAGPHLP